MRVKNPGLKTWTGLRGWLDDRGWRWYASHLGDYMKRWLIETPLGSIRLHRICRDDAGDAFHDHPWDFVTFMFRGSYREWTPSTRRHIRWEPEVGLAEDTIIEERTSEVFAAPCIRRVAAEQPHRLDIVSGPVWTLVLGGPKRREWGFFLDDGWHKHDEVPRDNMDRHGRPMFRRLKTGPYLSSNPAYTDVEAQYRAGGES